MLFIGRVRKGIRIGPRAGASNMKKQTLNFCSIILDTASYHLVHLIPLLYTSNYEFFIMSGDMIKIDEFKHFHDFCLELFFLVKNKSNVLQIDNSYCNFTQQKIYKM